MASDGWQPDFIVGIDFGMTCTAVAYSNAPEWPDPKHIQKWPGKPPYESHNKVDTCVAYNIRNDRLESWGFSCDPEDDGQEMNQYFKLNLDPVYKGPVGDPSHEVACKWYQDYMSSIREHTIRFLTESFPRFEQKRVEFVFSVPTTWRDPGMIRELEQHIAAAGYGRRPNERALTTLTEAEAAAVYALRSGMTVGETFLVCDAGGGTSDVNVLKVKSTSLMELEALSYTEGRAVGSTLIDFKVRQLIEQRLKLARKFIDGDLENIVERMMRGSFPSYKCNFGADGYDVPRFPLPIPGLPPGLDVPHAGIEDSKMVLTHVELQGIFDDQITAMQGLIDEQLKIVQVAHAHETISHLVLSGGLGSSPYVRRKMKERYEVGSGSAPANARNMRVLLADLPQLAVVHGLVMARIQTAKLGVSVYARKCCPISLGILCRKEYDEKEHQGEDVALDPFDKRRWAERQIEWIIKKGDVVHADWGQEHKYRKKIQMGDERMPQKCKIVMSTTSDRASLPKSLPKAQTRGDVRELCEIETVLDPGSLSRKNQHWWHLRKEYSLAEFRVRLLVGTGLRFEILNKDGRCAKTNDEIPVKWEPVVAQATPEEGPPEIYPWRNRW